MRARRKLWRWLLVSAIVVALYTGSFFLLRNHLSLTVMAEKQEDQVTLRGVQVFYLSKNPTANQVLYYLYWPIHRCLGYDEGGVQRLADGEDYPLPIQSPVYVEHVQLLRELEAEGFERRTWER